MGTRILIVEDEMIVQMDLQRRIERLGYGVAGLAVSGEEAIAKALELEPDAVLMDVNLQGEMDGLEAARRIRAVREVPIIYVTAFSSDVIERGMPGEHQLCVSKPFRTFELQSTLARVLGREQA